jgi:hypothetical protein
MLYIVFSEFEDTSFERLYLQDVRRERLRELESELMGGAASPSRADCTADRGNSGAKDTA